MDLSKVEQLNKRLEDFAKLQLNVGIPSSSNVSVEGGLNMATLAAMLEFGTEHSPERSSIRSTIIEHNGYVAELASATKKVARGEMEPATVLEALGLTIVGDIKHKIANGNFAPLKEATIKRKGSSKPLIDTGEFRQRMNFEVK